MGKRGPAPKGEYENKTNVLSTRIREDLRESLEEAARSSGKSLSQEIEHRLRRTFIDDTRIEDAFGSRRNYLLMRMVGLALESATRLMGSRATYWLDDPTAFDAAIKTMVGVMEAIRPEGSADPNPYWSENERDFTAEFLADSYWHDVQTAQTNLPLNTDVQDGREQLFFGMLRSDLGTIAERPQFQNDGQGNARRRNARFPEPPRSEESK